MTDENNALDQFFIQALQKLSQDGNLRFQPEELTIKFLSGEPCKPTFDVERLDDIPEDLGSAMLFSAPIRNMHRLFFILKSRDFIIGAVQSLHEVVFQTQPSMQLLEDYWQTLLLSVIGAGHSDAPAGIFPGLDEREHRESLLKSLSLVHTGRLDLMATLLKELRSQLEISQEAAQHE